MTNNKQRKTWSALWLTNTFARAQKTTICASTGVAYLGAQEIEASPVSAQVDEGVTRTEETELVSISTSSRTVHLITIKIDWVEKQRVRLEVSTIISGFPR